MSAAILDTSIFADLEQGRPLDQPLPERMSVSVVTIAELELGVLVARDPDTRAQRLATLTRVREEIAACPPMPWYASDRPSGRRPAIDRRRLEAQCREPVAAVEERASWMVTTTTRSPGSSST